MILELGTYSVPCQTLATHDNAADRPHEAADALTAVIRCRKAERKYRGPQGQSTSQGPEVCRSGPCLSAPAWYHAQSRVGGLIRRPPGFVSVCRILSTGSIPGSRQTGCPMVEQRADDATQAELPSTVEVARAFDALVVNREKLGREEELQALQVAQRSPQLRESLRAVESRRRPPRGDPLDRLHLLRIRNKLWHLAFTSRLAGAGKARSSKVEQYVTLDQLAALVSRSKHTVRKWEDLPAPDVAGGHGKPSEWCWSRLRPWLEERSGKLFPRRLPDPFRASAG